MIQRTHFKSKQEASPQDPCKKKQMRPGQPPDRIVREFSGLAVLPRGGRVTILAGQLPRGVLRLSSCRPRTRYSRNRRLRKITVTQPLQYRRPNSAQRASWRRRPQRPGNHSRTYARFRFPPAIHPRELPAAAATAAIVQQAKASRFRCTHFQIEHCAPQQENIPRLCRNCGR